MKTISFFLLLFIGLFTSIASGDTSVTAFASRWDTDGAGKGEGWGGRLKSTFLGFGAVEGRASVIEMDDEDTTLYPLDVSINARIPLLFSPYIGVGAGYTFMDSNVPLREDMAMVYAHAGLEITLIWFGVMAEVRVQDSEDNDYDGVQGNVGVLIKW